MAIFLLMFGFMWVSQLAQVISTGNTSAGDYLATPTSWWMVKFLDLGITIPMGFLALLLLLSKPKKAYPLVLLFYGFFITLGTAVNASAIIEVINKDPAVTTGSGSAGIIVFPVLGLLAYGGLFYLIKDKLHSQSQSHKNESLDRKEECDKAKKPGSDNVVVIYKSKYGATKRYAEWIAEELKTKALDISEFDTASLKRYSTVIYGSSVHIGKIKGIDFLKNNWGVLSTKKVVMFVSTGASLVTLEQYQVIETSLPANLRKNIICFPLPGAYDYNKLDCNDKWLMNLGPMSKLRFNSWFRIDKKSQEQLILLHEETDWTNKEAISPIIQCISNKCVGMET